MRVVDIRRITADSEGGRRVAGVDKHLLSPALQQPTRPRGGIWSVHSNHPSSLNGHSDVIGGVVVAADKAVGEESRRMGEHESGSRASPSTLI